VATSWEDIEKLGRPILWGSIAPGIGGHLLGGSWLYELGAPIKIVYGYGGTTETNAAFRRGETELSSSCATLLYRDYPDWITPENVAPVFWVGKVGRELDACQNVLDKAGLKRPPHILEVAKKYIKADWQKDAYEAANNLARLSKTFFLPKGVSDEVYRAWCNAFSKVVADPRFINILDPTYRDELAPLFAEEAQALLDHVEAMGPDAKNMLKILVEGH